MKTEIDMKEQRHMETVVILLMALLVLDAAAWR